MVPAPASAICLAVEHPSQEISPLDGGVMRSPSYGLPASRVWSPLIRLHQGASLPSLAVAFDPWVASRWSGWRPQPGNEHEDFVEHLSWHCDLGHLEHDIAAVADHFGADLDQLLPQTRQGPWFGCRGHCQGSHAPSWLRALAS